MNELVQSLLVFAVISCWFSLIFTTGKDPFFVLRWIWKKLRPCLSGFFQNISKQLMSWAKQLWKTASTGNVIVRALLYVGSIFLYLIGILVALPSALLGK